MEADSHKTSLKILWTTGIRVVRWTTIGASVGALGLAIYGILFAGIVILLHIVSYGFFNIAGYFALCGAAAGALVGGCGGLLYGGIMKRPSETSPRIAEPPTNGIAEVDPVARAKR